MGIIEYLYSILLGMVQGLTEFLPISSSGHLVIFQTVFGINLEEFGVSNLMFSVFLHLGTLIAVIVAYWRDIVEIISDLMGFLFKRSTAYKDSYGVRMFIFIAVATLPLVVLTPIKDRLEALFEMPFLVGCALLVTAATLFFADKVRGGEKSSRNMTLLDALIIGLFQMVAITPGLSRSGLSISGGLFRGFKRSFAVKFSFLISLPAVLGANILELYGAYNQSGGLQSFPVGIYLAGILSSAVFGYIAIQAVRYIARKGSFKWFSAYCVIAGLAVIIASIVM